MAINGVGAGYVYQNDTRHRTRTSADNDFYGEISAAAKQTTEVNCGKVIGLATIPDGNSNIFYGMKAQYAAEATEDNPVIQVTANLGGEYVSYKVNINDVDPRNASQLEMFALCSYADDKGFSSAGILGSYHSMKIFAENAEINGYISGLKGYGNFLNAKFDWREIVSRMMGDYLNAGVYKQYQAGQNLMGIIDRFDGETDSLAVKYSTKQEENRFLTTEEMMQKIRERMSEIYEKVKRGETEQKFQIGASSFTLKEWKSFIEKFDESEEEIEKQIKEAREMQKKAAAAKEAAAEKGSSKEEDGIETEIIVKPDGSKVLMITMSFAGVETTVSIQISKPSEEQDDKAGQDNKEGEGTLETDTESEA